MLRIGSGAGFSGDRLDPAIELAQKGNLDYLILECLAERTIALAQKRKKEDESLGYDPLLEKRMRSLLPIIKKQGVRLVTNMGAANPVSGAQKIIDIAEEMNISLKVAAVTGDDVLSYVLSNRCKMEFTPPLDESALVLSANAYMGAETIVPALQTNADIIITGRVADPSLFLAPMIQHFGWSFDDMKRLGKGTAIGHLLECGGQLTGGYFADPEKKDVPNMANLGFPYAEVQSTGDALLTKLPSTGGVLNLRTVKEQLLYEVMDPGNYITPDVSADFTSVSLSEKEANRIKMTGGGGGKKPDLLKVSVGYEAGFMGEGEITYAGENALARAELAGEIIKERLKDQYDELKVDLIGITSAHHSSFEHVGQPYEVRLRVAAKADCSNGAQIVGEEVEALYTNGPAGGGGARKYVHELIGIVSTMVPRGEIDMNVVIKETMDYGNQTV